MQDAQHILEKYWGYSSFRSPQKEIIEVAGTGRDVIALLPTGGGKSLCFQVPVLQKKGIGIVISPLLALMEDQVNHLQNRGIKAIALGAGIPFAEVDQRLDNCIYGNYKFLYLSPERLQQELVQERIKQMNVNLIAIDEAHCISQWGHDFRPAYLNLQELRKLKPEVPIMALTASATKKVVEDIQKELLLQDPVIFKESLARRNISFQVSFSEDKIYKVRQELGKKAESAILYVRSRKATTEIAQELQYYGYTALAFHGGLSAKEKSARLKSWFSEEVKIMVATNAFGMGIDKPNVRSVLHLHLPESIESYFQEAGRAGRDGKPANAIIITNKSDIPLLKNQFLSSLPDLQDTIFIYKKLLSYFRIAFGEGPGETLDFNFSDFCHQYKLNANKAFNTLQLLDRLSIINLSQQYQKKAALQFIISNKHLLHYLAENSKYETVVKAILRSYGGAFENKISLNLGDISQKSGASEKEIIAILKELYKDKLIDFEYRENDAAITFLVPREDENSIFPFAKNIKLQAEHKTEKIEALLEYVANDKICRSRQLLNYFGENTTKDCGICSVCQPEKKNFSKQELRKMYEAIVLELENGARNSKELCEQLPFSEKGILETLRLMLEKEIISLTGTNSYKLKHL